MANLTFTQSSVPAPSSPTLGKSNSVAGFFMSAIHAEEEKMTDQYTKELRKHAKEQYGWSEDLVEKIHIVYDEKHHKLTYDTDSEEAVRSVNNGDGPGRFALDAFVFGRS